MSSAIDLSQSKPPSDRRRADFAVASSQSDSTENLTDQSPGKTPARPHAAYWIVSLALAAVFLYFSLRGIEWSQVWTTLRHAQPSLVGVMIALSCAGLFLRSYRWRVLLSARGGVSIPLAFWATSAGYLGNNVLPARAGEVIRSLMISSRAGMSRTFVLTTALSERIVDAIALVTISAVVLLMVPMQAGWMMRGARPIAIVGLGGALALALLPVLEKFWFRTLERLPIPEKLRGTAEKVLLHVLDGIRSFHDPSRLTRFLLLTAVIWLNDAFVTVTGARSIGIEIGLPVAFLLVAGLGLGSALPSTPGYVGIYQFVAVSILTPFGYSKTEAIAYILLFQAMNYAVVLFWGLIGIARGKAKAAPSGAAESPAAT